MEQLSKLNIDMGAEEFANILETLEKKDFSFWKGRIVADKESNEFSLENLLQIFKALKETSNIEESQLEKLRLKLVDLYTPDKTINEIKDLFYSILAPLKGGIVRNNILGITEPKWKKVARVSLVTLTGALALGTIAVVSSKFLRSASHPQQQADTKLHPDCAVLSKMGIATKDINEHCKTLTSSKNLPLLKSIKSTYDEMEKQQLKISLELKEVKGKSLGFKDPKVLDMQKTWQGVEGKESTNLNIAHQNALDETSKGEAIELAEQTVKLACLNQKSISSKKEELQKEGLKVLFSLYGRKNYVPKAELTLKTMFSDLNKIEGKNLELLKDLILSSKSETDHSKEFILSVYQKTDLTDVQKNILDEVVTGSISKDPKYLEAALTQASSLFKKSSENLRGIKILSAILEKSSSQLDEKTRLNVIEILKTVSLNEKFEKKENNKDEKEVKTEAASFLELVSPINIKMTNEESIILAEGYLKRNTPVMKNVAFDLLSNIKTLNDLQKVKIATLIQQELKGGLLPSNLKSITKILEDFNTQQKFDISAYVLKDFVNNKNTAECQELANFMLNYINSSNQEKFYEDVNKFAKLLSDKTTTYWLFFSYITEMDQRKRDLALTIHLHLSNKVMPKEFWINLEKIYKGIPIANVETRESFYNAIKNNAKTIEQTKDGIKVVKFIPSEKLFPVG